MDNGGGKFGQWAGWWPGLKWLLTVRIGCKHPHATFARKVGAMSKFYCPSCDDHFYRRHDWH